MACRIEEACGMLNEAWRRHVACGSTHRRGMWHAAVHIEEARGMPHVACRMWHGGGMWHAAVDIKEACDIARM